MGFIFSLLASKKRNYINPEFPGDILENNPPSWSSSSHADIVSEKDLLCNNPD